jgi:hypothetical protein
VIVLTLAGQCPLDVQPMPDGNRVLIVADPQSGIQINIPLDDAAAHAIAAKLKGEKAIEIASVMPAVTPSNGHGHQGSRN